MSCPARRSVRTVRHEDGYTLTEMLVVIGIIALIAAVLTPGLLGQLGRARAKTAQMQLETVSAGVEMFRSDVGRYPTKDEGLKSLLAEPPNVEGWTGPYLKSIKSLQDPWNHAILYEVDDDGRVYDVKSLGADGRENGAGLDRDLKAPATQ
jgi:general secretion pathway protein G